MARVKKPIPGRIRREVARDHGGEPGANVPVRCAYCPATGAIQWHMNHNGTPSGWPVFDGLELDHIYPESRGGATESRNIALACRNCNRRKGARLENPKH